METNKYLWQPRKEGPIYIRVTYHDEQGRRREFKRSLRTRSWSDARRIRDAEFLPIILDMSKAKAQLEMIHTLYPELVRQLDQGVHGGWGREDPASSLTLKELFEQWHRAISTPGGNYSMAERTAARYAGIAEEFVLFAGEETAASDITSSRVAEYRDFRLQQRGRSKKTVSLELIALRGMFRFGAERLDLAGNPVDGVTVKWTKAQRNRERIQNRRRVPTREEADRVCTSIEGSGSYSAEEFRDFALFARYTGMRQGEIAQLQREDFHLYPLAQYVDQILQTPAEYARPWDPDAAVPADVTVCIHLSDRGNRRTKTGMERIVPVASKLLPAAAKRVGSARKNLFPSAAADRGARFGRAWLKKVKRVHEDLTMHGFRHYAASEMENGGVSDAVSRALLGHVDSSVHGGYVHVTVEVLLRGLEAIS